MFNRHHRITRPPPWYHSIATCNAKVIHVHVIEEPIYPRDLPMRSLRGFLLSHIGRRYQEIQRPDKKRVLLFSKCVCRLIRSHIPGKNGFEDKLTNLKKLYYPRNAKTRAWNWPKSQLFSVLTGFQHLISVSQMCCERRGNTKGCPLIFILHEATGGQLLWFQCGVTNKWMCSVREWIGFQPQTIHNQNVFLF